MDLIHNVKWQVSLSNGETFFENKGKYLEIPNEKSPWQRLIQYIAENKLKITSIALYTDLGQSFNLPSSGNNPKFKPFLDAEKPLDYNMFRSIAKEARVINMKAGSAKVSEWFTTIEAIYSNCKLQLWVDENNIKNCWTLIINR